MNRLLEAFEEQIEEQIFHGNNNVNLQRLEYANIKYWNREP